MEELHALNARRGDSLQVASDAFASDIGVDEMEPRFGIEDAVGMQKGHLVALRERASQFCRIRHCLIGCLRQRAKSCDRYNSKYPYNLYSFHRAENDIIRLQSYE